MRSYGLYLHVPFCASRCSYCTFYSTTDVRITTVDAYTDAVIRALETPPKPFADSQVETLYFGGGTPALLGLKLATIIEAVQERIGMCPAAEISVEANPGSLDRGIVESWQTSGVNRISLGVQSFDDTVLKILGRSHCVAETFQALGILSDLEMPTALDLLCGTPPVEASSWRANVEMALAFDPAHISIYPLTLETDSMLAQQVAEGMITLPDDGVVAEQMLEARDLLQSAGYEHYEIANYARDGMRSRHNCSYWTGIPYWGIGPSAASMFTHPDGSRTRGVAHHTLESFVCDPQKAKLETWDEIEILDPREALVEDLMLGMRLMEGVRTEMVEAAGLRLLFEQFMRAGLVDCEGSERYRFSNQGWLLGNEVFSALWDAR